MKLHDSLTLITVAAMIAVICPTVRDAFADSEGASACGADMDASGAVDHVDLSALLGAWGECRPRAPLSEPGGWSNCSSDLDVDGDVDGSDLTLLLAAWGPMPVFDYGPPMPNAEAAQIALEMLGPDGPLLPSAEEYQRVERDLALIRAFEPSLVDALHSPQWNCDELVVGAYGGFSGPGTTQYQCLTQFFQADVDPWPPCFGVVYWHSVILPAKLNVKALAQIFEAHGSVVAICPLGLGSAGGGPVCGACWYPLIGTLNNWHASAGSGGVWRWTVRHGNFCVGPQEVWSFTTDEEGRVTLMAHQGPEVFAGMICPH